MRVVTFASGARHVSAAARLRASLVDHAPGVELHVATQCGALTRREALKYKPRTILDALLSGSDDVIWLDADCVVRAALPDLPLGAEIGAFSPRPDYWVDGVLLVRNCRGGRALMCAWREALEKDGWEATDVVLSELMIGMEISVYNLAPEYCWREKWGMRERWGNREIKIEVTE